MEQQNRRVVLTDQELNNVAAKKYRWEVEEKVRRANLDLDALENFIRAFTKTRSGTTRDYVVQELRRLSEICNQ